MPANELSGVASAALPDPVAFLLDAEVDVEGRMPWSSNATFLVTMRGGDFNQQAIYKPVRGERPLWDFEPGLHKRERAAYLLSEALDFGVVPPTVIRDGPLGEGSFQWFVDVDHREHYFTIHEGYPHLHDQLRQIALLDVIANNTDRKSGHCLLARPDPDRPDLDRVWAIDNGLCFSAPFKLRTVIWEFGDEPIDEATLARIAEIAERPPIAIAALLTDDEIAALQHRAAMLAGAGRFPTDPSGRRHPWPLV